MSICHIVATLQDETGIYMQSNMGRAPSKTVTAIILKDPRPERAGRAPDCEDSRAAEHTAYLQRLAGNDNAFGDRAGYGLTEMAAARLRLAPRRWTPAQGEAQ